MRSPLRSGALVVVPLAVVAAGCGTVQPTSAESRGPADSSVRFRDVTTYVNEGQKLEDVGTGAFDWEKREGWIDWSYAGRPLSPYYRQVGEDCFSRKDDGTWLHWRAEGKNGLCHYLFERPEELLKTLRSNGTLDRVGPEKIGGVKTTHYRYVPSPEDTDDPEAWVDIWLDENKIVRRLERPDGEASPRARDYFDFGVDVHVKPPCRPRQAATHPTPALTGEKQQPVWCVEDTG